MGFFRVRKSFRICPGVKLNIGKKGITSLSIGKAGATVNLSSKGVKGTVGIPGTGISYTSRLGGTPSRRSTSCNASVSSESDSSPFVARELPQEPSKKITLVFWIILTVVFAILSISCVIQTTPNPAGFCVWGVLALFSSWKTQKIYRKRCGG